MSFIKTIKESELKELEDKSFNELQQEDESQEKGGSISLSKEDKSSLENEVEDEVEIKSDIDDEELDKSETGLDDIVNVSEDSIHEDSIHEDNASEDKINYRYSGKTNPFAEQALNSGTTAFSQENYQQQQEIPRAINDEAQNKPFDAVNFAAYTLASLVTLPITLPVYALNRIFGKDPINMEAVNKGNSPITKLNNDIDEVSGLSGLFSNSNIHSLSGEINRDARFSEEQKERAMETLLDKFKSEDGNLGNMAKKISSGSLSILKRDPKKLEKDLLSFISKNNSKKDLLDIAKKLDNIINRIPENFSPFKKVFNVLNNVLNIVKGILKTKFDIDLDSRKEQQSESKSFAPDELG